MNHPLSELPAWPATAPSAGQVMLRRFEDRDVGMVQELSTDPYVPLIGTLPPACDRAGALAYIARQRQRHVEGTGFSFAVGDAGSGQALGMIGLWLRDRALGRAQVGYAVMPRARGRGAATSAGFAVEGLLRGYLEIGGRRRDLMSYARIRDVPSGTEEPHPPSLGGA